MLAFVLDVVFKKKIDVTYINEQSYIFGERPRDGLVVSPTVRVEDAVVKHYCGNACRFEKGVLCIYEIYKVGREYSSFLEAYGMFCAVCLTNGVQLTGFEGVDSGERFYLYLSERFANHVLDAGDADAYRAAGNVLDRVGEEVGWKLFEINSLV